MLHTYTTSQPFTITPRLRLLPWAAGASAAWPTVVAAHGVLQCAVVCCSVVPCGVVCYSTLQCVATRLQVLTWATIVTTVLPPCAHTATHCNMLQHTQTLQRTAMRCNKLQDLTALCSTLRCTATHCNTLQHTATLPHAAAYFKHNTRIYSN